MDDLRNRQVAGDGQTGRVPRVAVVDGRAVGLSSAFAPRHLMVAGSAVRRVVKTLSENDSLPSPQTPQIVLPWPRTWESPRGAAEAA